MNYKQYSYNELLRGTIKDGVQIHSALILPYYFSSQDLHFSLSTEYIGKRSTGTKILEHYLNLKDVMNNYISN